MNNTLDMLLLRLENRTDAFLSLTCLEVVARVASKKPADYVKIVRELEKKLNEEFLSEAASGALVSWMSRCPDMFACFIGDLIVFQGEWSHKARGLIYDILSRVKAKKAAAADLKIAVGKMVLQSFSAPLQRSRFADLLKKLLGNDDAAVEKWIMNCKTFPMTDKKILLHAVECA